MKQIISCTGMAVLLILLSGILSCQGLNKKDSQWEGITGNTLKVTIFEFFLFDENADDEIIKIQIMEKLNQRAALLLASYISLNLDRDKTSSATDDLFNKEINTVLTGGTLTKYECGENNYCSADSVYNIETVLNNLKKINNR